MQTAVVDVTEFLEEITGGYTHLGRRAARLCRELPSLSPTAIRAECVHLQQEKQKLVKLDEQFLEILALAGEELTNGNDLVRYQKAFSFARNSIDTLHTQLHAMKAALRRL